MFFVNNLIFPEKKIKVSRLWQSMWIISTDEKNIKKHILKTKSENAEFVKKSMMMITI